MKTIKCASKKLHRKKLLIISSSTFGILSPTYAATFVTFTDIAKNPETGITYHRTRSPSDAIFESLKKRGAIFVEDTLLVPANNRGAPGVAILDYDNDGDMDIYVTNGPGSANSLYSNQMTEQGKLEFIDVAEHAGVAAYEQDSTGVCYGDIDNDGDTDLLVLGAGSGHRLYENNGNGTFKDISDKSGIGGVDKYSGSCSMGDVNGDGYLDIAIANSWDNWDNRIPLMTFDHIDQVDHNQLFLNIGENKYKDVSAESGIQRVIGVTWAIALVDYDLDGDVDLITADDQGPRPAKRYGGADMGYLRVYNNDGTGKFVELTQQLGLEQYGGWMSLSFGDLNNDGYMDFFASNVGDYSSFITAPMFGFQKVKGEWASSWFFGKKDGGFVRQSTGEIGATTFGWGSAIVDYDNDGDSDIIFHGGLDFALFQDGSNPGAILNNDGKGIFSRDDIALANSTNHTRRNTKGLAVGDLDGNGFVDIVTVSNQNWPNQAPLAPYPDSPIGGQFDQSAFIWPTFSPVDPTDPTEGFVWNGIEEEDGTLTIELNNGENNNHFIKVKVRGSVGEIDNARANRSGIGAVVTLSTNDGKRAMYPIVSGATYASQHSSEWIFGLGTESYGTLDILWPGGVRNKLYNVIQGETVRLPEIPCSYDAKKIQFKKYKECVEHSLEKLEENKVISGKEKRRFYVSAIRAYKEQNKKSFLRLED